MKKIRIKAKELNQLVAHYIVIFSKKDQVELWQDKEKNLKIYAVNNEPAFFHYTYESGIIKKKMLLPTLKFLQKQLILKEIVVDMGAIKFVVKGADIMRPGITEIDGEIQEGEAIVIVDETHRKPISVGIAQITGERMQAETCGKVIKNIHYVGDKLWNL